MTELQPGDRVQWMDTPGYLCGTVRTFTAARVFVELDNGCALYVRADNVRSSLRRILEPGRHPTSRKAGAADER